VLPPLISGYALAVRMPRLRAALGPRTVGVAGLGAIAFAAAALVPLGVLDRLQAPQRAARFEREREAGVAQHEAELAGLKEESETKFRSLNPDSPLRDYLDYISWTRSGTPEHEHALAGARQVTHRQDNTVELLDAGNITWLEDMWQFKLEATPALCTAYERALGRLAGREYDGNVGGYLEDQLPNMKFLVAGHCGLDPGLSAAEARVRKIMAAMAANHDDPRLIALLAGLVELHQAH